MRIGEFVCDRRHPGEIEFPGLVMIGMVESETTSNGVVAPERRYHLCSKAERMPASCSAASISRISVVRILAICPRAKARSVEDCAAKSGGGAVVGAGELRSNLANGPRAAASP